MARTPTKKYRLVRGSHSVPNSEYTHNPDADPNTNERVESHIELHAEDNPIVELNDDQYAAFKDKFAPVESDASYVRDEDNKKLQSAQAAAARTGQMQDPNK